MKVLDRFLNYVKIYTTSDHESSTTPSTQRQFDLAHLLVKELQEIGIGDAHVDENCYVYGTIPASKDCGDCVSLGLIAHMDTAPDACGEGVSPQVIRDYDGEDVVLGKSGHVLLTKKFPHLKKMKGCTLVTTDGTTLLGADDKAGIAEIMTVAEKLMTEEIPHGKICICFTSDEEIGGGARHLDVEKFGADYAYTLDGGSETEIVYENFNACSAIFEIDGFNIHPGDSKDKMINASLVAMEINQMLPGCDIPARTEMYEGFYHLTDIAGNVEHARMHYIVRDHDLGSFEARRKTLLHIEKTMNEKYGPGTVTLRLVDEYRNMVEKIRPCMHLVDNVKEVIRQMGLEPDSSPVRGGTDGAQLSFRGLPCPNLGTGGHAAHGPYEHITEEGMERVVKIVLGIIKKYASGAAVNC